MSCSLVGLISLFVHLLVYQWYFSLVWRIWLKRGIFCLLCIPYPRLLMTMAFSEAKWGTQTTFFSPYLCSFCFAELFDRLITLLYMDMRHWTQLCTITLTLTILTLPLLGETEESGKMGAWPSLLLSIIIIIGSLPSHHFWLWSRTHSLSILNALKN